MNRLVNYSQVVSAGFAAFCMVSSVVSGWSHGCLPSFCMDLNWSRCVLCGFVLVSVGRLCGFEPVSAGRAPFCIVLNWSCCVLFGSVWFWAGLGWSCCVCVALIYIYIYIYIWEVGGWRIWLRFSRCVCVVLDMCIHIYPKVHPGISMLGISMPRDTI